MKPVMVLCDDWFTKEMYGGKSANLVSHDNIQSNFDYLQNQIKELQEKYDKLLEATNPMPDITVQWWYVYHYGNISWYIFLGSKGPEIILKCTTDHNRVATHKGFRLLPTMKTWVKLEDQEATDICMAVYLNATPLTKLPSTFDQELFKMFLE